MENAKSLAPNKEVNNEKMGYFFKRCPQLPASTSAPSLPQVRSPDGSCFLTCSDDNTFCSFTLPYVESGWLADTSSSAADTDSYAASLVMSEGESVYDYCRYPYMSSSSPETCVFASTARDHPIHLWDATTGQLRCTYRAYDAMDEIIAAFSIAFNPAGTKIFAGYNKSVRTFDIHRPGRDFTQHSTLQGNKEGQSGIFH
nr:telomerase Cajal body protein 1-like [Nicotiana tomentosiformis]